MRRRLAAVARSCGSGEGAAGRTRQSAPMSDFVIVEQAGNEAMADLVKQRLDEAGIPSMIAPGNLAAMAGAGASFAISVPAEKADEARKLLNPS
jgi:hypothetical protein